MTINSRYYKELTVFSGIAILFVLCIHASGSALGSLFPAAAGYEEADWFLRSLFNLVAPAVPMFIFASGYKYYLHDRDTPYLLLLKKRLPRVLMSFTIINTLFWALDAAMWMDRFDPVLLAKTYLSSWLGNTVAYPLWYIPMYCFVLMLCPAVNRVLHSCGERFALYFAVGLAQKLLSASVAVLSEKPLMFIGYPAFFELGFIAAKLNWKDRLHHRAAAAAVYLAVVVAVSCWLPVYSRTPAFQYVVLYGIGTVVYFQVSILLRESRILCWLGSSSYPVFLLHEPIIGRLTGKLIQRAGVQSTWFYAVLWVTVVLAVTSCLVSILRHFRVSRVLWKFRLSGVR